MNLVELEVEVPSGEDGFLVEIALFRRKLLGFGAIGCSVASESGHRIRRIQITNTYYTSVDSNNILPTRRRTQTWEHVRNVSLREFTGPTWMKPFMYFPDPALAAPLPSSFLRGNLTFDEVSCDISIEYHTSTVVRSLSTMS